MWPKVGYSVSFLSSTVRTCARITIKRKKHSHVGVLSAPFHKGQPKAGVKTGPEAIKETGIFNRLKSLGIDVVDYGVLHDEDKDNDLVLGPNGERHHSAVLSYCKKVADSVSSVVQKGGLCLTLGGDHSIGIGTIHGHAQANLDHQVVVLWIDAHPDINTGTLSKSGNMHGMSVAYHIREIVHNLNRLPDNWPQPCLSAKHLAYIGLRDVDEAERKIITDLGILSYDMRDVERVGIREVISHCLEVLQPSASRPLHVSFDIDSLDPIEAPSTGTPVRAGLTLREGLQIVEGARDSGFLKAFDLVEVNPDIGSSADRETTLEAAKSILLAALAGKRGT